MRYRRCKHIGCHAMIPSYDCYCSAHISDSPNRKTYNHVYNATTRKRAVKENQYKFYRSKEWKSIREGILLRDSYLCQYCKQKGIIRPGNIVDHIVPVEYDSNLKSDLSNLITCCKPCHNVKTKWERNYYGTGAGNEVKNVGRVQDINLLVKLLDAHKASLESR